MPQTPWTTLWVARRRGSKESHKQGNTGIKLVVTPLPVIFPPSALLGKQQRLKAAHHPGSASPFGLFFHKSTLAFLVSSHTEFLAFHGCASQVDHIALAVPSIWNTLCLEQLQASWLPAMEATSAKFSSSPCSISQLFIAPFLIAYVLKSLIICYLAACLTFHLYGSFTQECSEALVAFDRDCLLNEEHNECINPRKL